MTDGLAPATGTPPAAVGSAGRTAGPRRFAWIVETAAVGAAVLRHMVRPVTWRRPVRREFIRFMGVAGVDSVPSVAVAAILAGLGLLFQGLWWLEQFGQARQVSAIIQTILVREVAPLTVGMLAIGHSGLIILSELSRMRADGRLRALDSQGVDPFVLFVVPRVAALSLSVFCLTMLFVAIAPGAGLLAALALGVTTQPPGAILLGILSTIGAQGYAVLPLKSLGIGFAIGTVCCVTAMTGPDVRSRRGDGALLAVGFFRALLLTFLISGMVSLMVR
ncbi:MAG TPA: ABC transporter permease [Azospirillum sp.]|nr:ABC transporter permease [Azospirillum sp.]